MTTRPISQGPAYPRRFYRAVGVTPAGDGFAVTLDARTLKTPQARAMVLPTRALADLIAGEWEAQGEEIVAPAMPATRLAFTAIDRVADFREETAGEVARFAASDLLCYFAEAPTALVERQVAHWAPVLAWAKSDLGLSFERTVGIQHRPQPQATVDAVKDLALRLDDYALTGLAHAAALFGSAVLALALERDKLDAQAAFDLSRLDEIWQEEQWGQDAEAMARTEGMRAEAVVLERLFLALRG